MNEVPEIPGYKILNPIGQGAMAVVYLAVQESLDRKVALKVMEPALAKDRMLCARFLKEGKFVARMSSHPDIVTIYDIGCHGQCYYMAMEYIPAGSLKDRILQGKGIKQPLAVIRDISSALKHAHDSGIIHRDVKPGNILFRDDGSAVLADFGIAKDDDSETQFTRIGLTVGSPAYMSLEQRIGGHLDARSDLYSLGVVLYEMLTGNKLFPGKCAKTIANAQKNGQIPLLPDDLSTYQGLVNQLLAKNPEDRFQDAQELINAIDTLLAGDTGDGTSFAKRSSRSDSGKRRALPIRGWGIGLGIVFTLGALSWIFAGKTPQAWLGAEPASSEVKAGDAELSVSLDKQKVLRLLDIAAAHLAVGRVTEPPGANAFEAYTMVLEIDPDNEQAKRGLSRVEQLIAENR